MTFRLEITFSGLCLFVPEAPRSGLPATGRLHVLLPCACDPMTRIPQAKSAVHGQPHSKTTNYGKMPDGSTIVPHLPRLVYSLDYLKPPRATSTATAGRDKKAPAVADPTCQIDLPGMACIDLQYCRLIDLSEFAPRSPAAPLPSELLSASGMARTVVKDPVEAQVHSKWVCCARNDIEHPLAARIVLDGSVVLKTRNTGVVTIGIPNANDEVTPYNTVVTSLLSCTVNVQRDSLAITLDNGTQTVLYPVRDRMKLLIGNMPAEGYEPKPHDPPGMSSHFPAFYPLLRAGSGNPYSWPAIVPDQDGQLVPPNKIGGSSAWAPELIIEGITPVTCASGSGCLTNDC
jgi:hypothetical protein